MGGSRVLPPKKSGQRAARWRRGCGGESYAHPACRTGFAKLHFLQGHRRGASRAGFSFPVVCILVPGRRDNFPSLRSGVATSDLAGDLLLPRGVRPRGSIAGEKFLGSMRCSGKTLISARAQSEPAALAASSTTASPPFMFITAGGGGGKFYDHRRLYSGGSLLAPYLSTDREKQIGRGNRCHPSSRFPSDAAWEFEVKGASCTSVKGTQRGIRGVGGELAAFSYVPVKLPKAGFL